MLKKVKPLKYLNFWTQNSDFGLKRAQFIEFASVCEFGSKCEFCDQKFKWQGPDFNQWNLF